MRCLCALNARKGWSFARSKPAGLEPILADGSGIVVCSSHIRQSNGGSGIEAMLQMLGKNVSGVHRGATALHALFCLPRPCQSRPNLFSGD